MAQYPPSASHGKRMSLRRGKSSIVPTPSALNSTSSNMNFSSNHYVTLGTGSGVILPSTTYYYIVSAIDTSGNRFNTPLRSIVTAAAADTTPPTTTLLVPQFNQQFPTGTTVVPP